MLPVAFDSNWTGFDVSRAKSRRCATVGARASRQCIDFPRGGETGEFLWMAGYFFAGDFLGRPAIAALQRRMCVVAHAPTTF